MCPDLKKILFFLSSVASSLGKNAIFLDLVRSTMWGRVVSCVYVKAWPCHSCLFTSLASISTAFLFSHCQCWIVTGSSIVFTKLPCVTPTTGARQTFRVGWHLALADLFLCTGKNVSVHVSFPVTVCWVLHAQVFGRGRFVDLEVEALFFFFSFAESEKCGSPKIHVCTEDRLLPPMFLAQEKTSAGLSILRQLSYILGCQFTHADF